MEKLILLLIYASLAIACSSPVDNTGTNAGANRSSSATGSTSINARTSTLNENAYTTGSNSSLGLLKPSVGKTAGEIKLWQNKEINARLEKLMGADFTGLKKFWNTETPIKKFGDFLMMTGCEQHNCGSNQYVILMNTADGNINVIRRLQLKSS